MLALNKLFSCQLSGITSEFSELSRRSFEKKESTFFVFFFFFFRSFLADTVVFTSSTAYRWNISPKVKATELTFVLSSQVTFFLRFSFNYVNIEKKSVKLFFVKKDNATSACDSKYHAGFLDTDVIYCLNAA